MTLRLAIIALFLSACATVGGGASNNGINPPVYHNCGNGWLVWMAGSATCPAANGSFPFPTGDATQNHIDEVMRQIPPKAGMMLAWGVTGSATFTAADQGSPGCDETPKIRPQFSAIVGPNPAGRWYWNAAQPLSSKGGIFTIDANPADWHDVNGQSGTANPAAFATAFAKAPTIGFVFGTDCRNAHGVGASGPETFFENGL